MRSETEIGEAFKHPDAAPYYGVDWQDVIGTDPISNSTWSAVHPGVTVTGFPTTGTTTIVQVAGGKRGFDYLAKNVITTTGGIVAAGEIRIKVR